VTRADLSAGQQAVQAAHALREFAALFPEEDRRWYETSNTLVMKTVRNEFALHSLLTQAKHKQVKTAPFREPDRQNEMTAIALEPSDATEVLCRGLPLALRGK
jgi:hypothetical protein